MAQLEYIGLIHEGELAAQGYPGKPMHHIRVIDNDGVARVERLNAVRVGATPAEAVAWLTARLAEDEAQAELDALIGLEV